MTEPHAPLLALFPIEVPRVIVQLVDEPPRAAESADEVWATVQVLYFDAEGQIANILEQTLRFAAHLNHLQPRERLQACVEAHRRVFVELFERRLAADEHWVALPHELLFFDELLSLRRPFSPEEFEQALRTKKRLGRSLG